jgi:general bacterial porin, GBP family
MKFTKTIMAAAAALSFGAAAQAQQSSVTLYGTLDAGLGYSSISAPNEASRSNLGATSGVSRPTVFGIRGVESLGNGNSVVFNLASQFSMGNGAVSTDSFFGQQATLGIRNDRYGQVDIGRQTNIASKYFQSIDPFSTFYGQAGMGASFGTTNNLRYSNMLMYQTTAWNGLSAGVGYSFNTGLPSAYANSAEVFGPTNNYGTMNNPRALTLGVNYANGPLQVAATYDQIMPASDVGNGTNSTPKAWVLGAAYDFRVVKASLAYGQTRSGAISGTLPSAISGIDRNWASGGVLYQDGYGANSYLLGLSAPVGGSGKVMASVQLATPTGSADIAANGSQSVYSLGYEYSFTKRTTAYAVASYANNYLMIDGVKSTSVGVGLRHQF